MNESYGLELSSYDYSPIFNVIIQPFVTTFYTVFFTALSVFFAFLVYACLKYSVNPFRLRPETLRKKKIRFKLFDCMRWLYIDFCTEKKDGSFFDQYGFTLYCGPQGSGKTTSMIEYLNRMHKRFPKAWIVTNFRYKYATHVMKDWRDFFELRNGTDGVIFAIDEIHSEFSTQKSKNFPESLLSEISQQRKQRVKIVGTSQVYSRVAKPIREQCFTVVQCVTYCHRWTFTREYEAASYELQSNAVQVKKRIHPINRHSFVQSDKLRKCFDTYEKIERLKDEEFMLRMEH